MILIQIHSKIHSNQHVRPLCISLSLGFCLSAMQIESMRELETERHRMKQLIADTNVRLWEQLKRAKEFYACIGERRCVYDFVAFFFSCI